MGWWRDLFSTEKRTITSVPWVPFNVGPGRFDASPSQTMKSALSLAPVYAAVRIIAQDVSTLPIKGYRRVGEERVPMASLPALFGDLQDSGKLIPWLFQLVTSLALRGNAYGLVTSRDGFQHPTAISWLNPVRVTHDNNVARPTWYLDGREIPREDMVHIPWFSLPGEIDGLSPIGAFAATIGVGLKAQSYASDWFDAGGFPPGTFQNTAMEIVDQAQADTVKARLVNAIRSRQPLVYGKDWEYKPVTVPAGEAQWVETAALTANQIAPIYGVRPEKIGGTVSHSLTYATVEQNQLEYTTGTLRFWLELLEGAFFALLPERQYVKFNADALVRSDLTSRYASYAVARQIGLLNRDEMRAMEDRPPLPNGEGQSYDPLQSAPPQSAGPSADIIPLKVAREWSPPA